LKNLLILGAGDNGRVIAENAFSSKKYKSIEFLDDLSYKKNGEIIGPLESIYDKKIKNKFTEAIISISSYEIRMKWHEILKKENYLIPNIIHKSSFVSESAKIGAGSIIYPKVCIQANVDIKESVFLNTGSIIEHDSLISNGVHICPGVNIAGNVTIGYGSWIGIGSSIIQGIRIGSETIIGAGSVVIQNIPDQSKAVGNPTRII
tara:strand:+ start:5002 stop:5616 length:615 start_codon:yes stop_codon:yes gene_type:complete